MDSPEQAVRACREILRRFVAGMLDYGDFRRQMSSAMQPLDPLDWALGGLDEDAGKEAAMYSEWLGGEFGETEARIPRKPDWKYGDSDEPYGWIDQEEYRARLRAAFAGVLARD